MVQSVNIQYYNQNIDIYMMHHGICPHGVEREEEISFSPTTSPLEYCSCFLTQTHVIHEFLHLLICSSSIHICYNLSVNPHPQIEPPWSIPIAEIILSIRFCPVPTGNCAETDSILMQSPALPESLTFLFTTGHGFVSHK